jgi:hypothetical protein
VCTCGATSAGGEWRETGEWADTWRDVRDHLIESGQITPQQAGNDPYAGRSGPIPHNPLTPFRIDDDPAKRRAAREYFGIPSPPPTKA